MATLCAFAVLASDLEIGDLEVDSLGEVASNLEVFV